MNKTEEFDEDLEFTLNSIPLDILPEVNFIRKELGNYEDDVYAIFKCKHDCKTIFTKESIEDMERFGKEVASIENWPYLCHRYSNGNKRDGFGCSDITYENVTWEYN